MLKAHGKFILPDNVPSNEFLNLEGDKLSTSRNWAVWLHEYLVDFPNKQDVLRYVLTANAPETKDNDFTWSDFQARNNNELVAVYGNFVNRTLVLTNKYFDGKVPPLKNLTETDKQVLESLNEIKASVEALLDDFHFRDAQKVAMNLARVGNKYLTETEPWQLAKTDMERVGTILHVCLQLVANLAIVFEPFLQFSSEKLRNMINLSACEWDDLGKQDILQVGHSLGKVALLFDKIEDAEIAKQLNRLEEIKQANIVQQEQEALKSWQPQPIKAPTDIETFDKMDIRVGKVLKCEKVPKSEKLLRFTIDDGVSERTILSGIAQSYPNCEVLVGKQILFVANFPPRKMMGIESNGMILSVCDADGRLVVTTASEEVKNGTTVG